MKSMIVSLFSYFPWLKKIIKGMRNYLMPSSNVSTHYVSLGNEEAGTEAARLRNAWQDEGLPLKQRDLVDQQLRRYRAGTPIDVFDVMVNALRELPEVQSGMSLLEVGCSSGFYSEVLEIPLKEELNKEISELNVRIRILEEHEKTKGNK